VYFDDDDDDDIANFNCYTLSTVVKSFYHLSSHNVLYIEKCCIFSGGGLYGRKNSREAATVCGWHRHVIAFTGGLFNFTV